MHHKSILSFILILLFFPSLLSPLPRANAAPSAAVSAYELIAAMNALRLSNGLPALIEHPIVNAVAQGTAETMAANEMSWHIGNVRGRLAAAGYGGGATVWATENFAYGNMSIDEIMVAWSDAEHMRPAVVPAYCHVGAGVAQAPNGMYYYVLQAAYTSSNSCGPYIFPGGSTPDSSSGSTPQPGANPVSQIIIPVKTATPDADGKIYHTVQAGQSLWAIAIAYHITIRDIEVWNNILRSSTLRIGQRLFIPGSNTQGYSTPTPVGMVITSTPDADGKIIHVVEPYQTLTTIAQAYKVTVEAILALNGIQIDWPLQIGQKLVIYPGNITPSPTPRPLSPVEKLTPESDGKYYHTVQSGETLSWIANLYKIALADLMAWNWLNNDSIIRPGQKLLLQVTPPATPTNTPGPPTATSTDTLTPAPPTVTQTPSLTPLIPTATLTPTAPPGKPANVFPWIAGIALLGLIVLVVFSFRKQ